MRDPYRKIENSISCHRYQKDSEKRRNRKEKQNYERVKQCSDKKKRKKMKKREKLIKGTGKSKI